MSRPVVHLVCQAHLDPVWMWTWEEGLREAISTFRTAVDLLDAYPEFVFNHNESLLYEWVETYDPPLFARIAAAVAAGRWNITGGWYLQPDLNIPGGETLVRLMLEGRRYFAERFGVRPPVAYNFDSFGHPTGLPQLLRGAGFDLYIHCRPTDTQLDLPAPIYRWRGCDGSEVIAVRPDAGWYCTPRPGQAEEQARNGIEIARREGHDVLVLWGLGDHGGGATRQHLDDFRALFAEFADADVELRHSTPEAFLAGIAPISEALPVFEGELQRTLSGTYTSVAPIKRAMRETEALLASAERWAALAWWRFGRAYPADALREAWKELMFNSFHDTLCGSLLEDAVPGVMDIFGSAKHTARQILIGAQHALAPAVPPAPDTVPVVVLNPHAVPLRAPVGVNILSHYAPPPERRPMTLVNDQGQVIAHQEAGGPYVLQTGTWQPFVGFVADVPPLSARRYEVRFESTPAPPTGELTVTETDDAITVQNAWWTAQFERATAALTGLTLRATGRELLRGPVQITAMQDVSHAWGGENRFVYSEPVSPLLALDPAGVGDFAGVEGASGPALRVINAGPVSVTVEGLVGWQQTRASVQVTFYADLPIIDLHTRLFMGARRKMIKLVLPFALPDARAVCEVPYGATDRPADSTEYPCGRWVRLDAADATVGVANSGQSGFDAGPDGVLRLSLTRGGVHCSWEGDPGGPAMDVAQSYTWMDQGQIDTRFRLVAGADADAVAAETVLAALALNQPLERFFTFYPPTPPPDAPAGPVPFLQVDPPTVVLGALKKADADDALIVRLAETVGQATRATVHIDGMDAPQIVEFGPFQVRTFKLRRDGGGVAWQPSDVLES